MPEVERIRFGELESVLIRPDPSPQEFVVVLCHGYGAPGTDLVPIGLELLEAGLQHTAFAFPAAPLVPDIPPGMECRAWWPIDVDLLVQASQSGQLDLLRHEQPADLPAARDRFLVWLAGLHDHLQLDYERTYLGGFSQGAMLATEVALTIRKQLAGLVLYSGNLLCEERWRELAGGTPRLQIIQSHGRMDPILPFKGAEALCQLLQDAGHEVRFIPFNGMHQIPTEALDALLEALQDRLGTS